MFKLLVITGSFACGMAFITARRAISTRSGGKSVSVCRAHVGSFTLAPRLPHVASTVQTVIATLIVLLFFITGKDPYADIYTLLALLGTMGIMIVQALCAFAVIVYFHGNKENIGKGHWFKQALRRCLGDGDDLYRLPVIQKYGVCRGRCRQLLLYHAIPWIVLACFCFGAAIAVWFYLFDAQKYRVIGRIVLTDD